MNLHFFLTTEAFPRQAVLSDRQRVLNWRLASRDGVAATLGGTVGLAQLSCSR